LALLPLLTACFIRTTTIIGSAVVDCLIRPARRAVAVPGWAYQPPPVLTVERFWLRRLKIRSDSGPWIVCSGGYAAACVYTATCIILIARGVKLILAPAPVGGS
jgi:hypothetical protein